MSIHPHSAPSPPRAQRSMATWEANPKHCERMHERISLKSRLSASSEENEVTQWEASDQLVEMRLATSSFLLLVEMPGATSPCY